MSTTNTSLEKAGSNLPPVLAKISNDQLLTAMERLIPTEAVKHKPNSTELNLVLMDVQKKYPNIPTPDVIEFLYLSMTTGARPLNKEVYAIAYKQSVNVNGQWVKQDKLQTVFSYHFLNMVAERTGELDGIQASSEWVKEMNDAGEERVRLKATAKVFRKGNAQPTVANAYYDEYVQTTKKEVNGKKVDMPKGQWATAKNHMTEKCAIAKAMRLTWPNSMRGIYIEEEMGAFFRQSVVVLAAQDDLAEELNKKLLGKVAK